MLRLLSFFDIELAFAVEEAKTIIMLDVIRRLSVPPKGAKFGSGPETILGSAVVCSILFGILQATGIALPKNGPKLKRADVLQWNMRVVSTVHALILTVGALEFQE